MSLERWWRELKLLMPHEPTTVEIRQLFDVVDRELGDALRGVSDDNRFNFCYNAAHTLCVIALHAEGYETSRRAPGHHATAINSLAETLGQDHKETVAFLSLCSRKRSQSLYERTGVVTKRDADDLQEAAARLRAEVVDWLARTHADLMPTDLK